MSPELDKKLCEAFPLLYRDRHGDVRTTAMCWGFDCGDGWFQLLWDLSAKLEPLIAAYEAALSDEERERVWQFYGGPPLRASQVKEKYGTLRFYMTASTPEMDEAIREAERLSAVTCEICGKPGELRGIGWVQTLCDICAKEQGYVDEEDE
jgi:hypothetical protein